MTDAPPILAGVPGTYPHSVFAERHPKLIEQVIAALPYDPGQRAALWELLEESRNGRLRPLPDDAADAEQWLRWGREMWGRPWADATFLWAESYFYRRLLAATGYFGHGPWRGIDPFGPAKAAELDGQAVDAQLAALDELSRAGEPTRRDALLVSALWGNQADLGFAVTGAPGSAAGLLADDRAALWSALSGRSPATVCVIADNAGRELLPDLILVDHLLAAGLADRVVVYLKPQPYYVSDATMADLLAAVRRLMESATTAARAAGERIRRALTEDRLIVRTHEFFCAPLAFRDLPADLTAEFAVAAMTICKGDLNYRRLVGDRYWPPTASFTELTDYFPAPVTALRTLKSDVVVGLSESQVHDLDATGEQWRTSGAHALIQCSVTP